MIKLKLCLTCLFLVSGLFTVGWVFPQDAETPAAAVSPYEQCVNNFDIAKINFKDPSVASNVYLLKEYLECRAVNKDDIRECNILTGSDKETCREYFEDYYLCFGKLAKDGRISSPVLNAWVKVRGLDSGKASAYIAAWLKNDVSFCDTFGKTANDRDECKAMITGDSNLCVSDSCGYRAPYIKALKTKKINECKKIVDDDIAKTICEASVSVDEGICEKNAGFEAFRDQYCRSH